MGRTTGDWLFRHRGVLPVALLPAVAWAVSRPAPPLGGDRGWQAACLAVSLAGLALRAWTVGTAPAGTSGRNTGRQIAERLNTTGPYSLVRNPLYLGNALMWCGLVVYTRSALLSLGVALCFALLYVPIVRTEEAFLRDRFGAAFETWAARTPAIVPRLRGFTPAALPFSPRNVLRREYSGFAALLVLFGAEVVARASATLGALALDPLGAALMACAGAVYVTLRSLKHHTRLLHVEGR